MSEKRSVVSRRVEWLLLGLILGLAGWLRLANLAENPGWYTDEATHLLIAGQLLRGRVQYMAIGDSWLLFARLPLFECLLAAALWVASAGMLTLRSVTGLLGVASVGLLYGLVRASGAARSRWLGLLAALLLAVYPPAVLYSRFGFSYNLLTCLLLLACLGILNYWRGGQRRWLLLAALAAGLGAVTDVQGVLFAGLGWLLLVAYSPVGAHRWRDALLGGVVIALPLAIYALVMLLTARQAFLFDLAYILRRLNGVPLAEQGKVLANNLGVLLRRDGWFAVGLVGALLPLPVGRELALLRRLGRVMLLLPLVVVGRTVALYSLSAYYTIVMLPFVVLGAVVLVGWLVARGVWSGGWMVLGVMVLAVPISATLVSDLLMVHGGYVTEVDPFLLDGEDAQRAAAFVNGRVGAADVVIASPGVAWLLESQTADFQMAVAANEQATPHLPANIPAGRFVFDPGYARARFVVVDQLWRNWAVYHVPGLEAQLQSMAAGWPLVFRAGEITVYQNPAGLSEN